jgi:hypothetical protein
MKVLMTSKFLGFRWIALRLSFARNTNSLKASSF